MLSVVGLGHAYPATVIDNECLARLNPEFDSALWLKQTGIRSRFSSLPLSYIEETGNKDPSLAIKAALESPTALAARACRMALDRAGVKAEEVGLILADCSTPWETCPGEAQRVGRQLGVKIPAYDVCASTASLCAHLEMLGQWKESRVPRYVLCISTNTPTQSMHFRGSGPAALASMRFGDGAGAVLVSGQVPGRLRIRQASFFTRPQQGQQIVLPCFGYLMSEPDAIPALIEPALQLLMNQTLEEGGWDGASRCYVGAQCNLPMLERLAERAGQPAVSQWQVVERCGDMLGSGPIAALSEHWEETTSRSDTKILVGQAGPGFGFGQVLLES